MGFGGEALEQAPTFLRGVRREVLQLDRRARAKAEIVGAVERGDGPLGKAAGFVIAAGGLLRSG